jgi:thiamine transport system permease protein
MAALPAILIMTAVIVPVLAVIAQAGSSGALTAADWSALRFTLGQAALSAVLSVALAVPVARALARRRFPGRALLVTVFGAPFFLPTVVAVLGLLAVFGRGGWLNDVLRLFGLGAVDIYGVHGVVLAHVFLNLPLAVRFILNGWLSIPAERFRLATSLGMQARDIGRFVERPMLREVVPGLLLAIFLICLSSFAVALILGGGPRATTLELAIYQAFRFEFDLAHAASLGLVQLALTAGFTALAALTTLPSGIGTGLDRVVERWDAGTPLARLADMVVLTTTTMFLALPLAAVAWRGAAGVADLPASIWGAALRSVCVALAATAVAVPLALVLARARHQGGWTGGLSEVTAMMTLAASPLVVGTGLFILLRQTGNPAAYALAITAGVNALVSLPFAYRAIRPGYASVEQDYGRLADSLGMHGVARLRLLTLPRLRRPLGYAAGLTAALSMGDLGVIALFADPARATLPLQVQFLAGTYQTDAAAGAALVLVLISLGLFWVFDRGGRVSAST